MASLNNPDFKCWTPSIPLKKADNIVSSEFQNAKSFKPSYDRDPTTNIEQLMTNEYQRMWLKERDDWIKKTAAPKPRRFSQRSERPSVLKKKEEEKSDSNKKKMKKMAVEKKEKKSTS